ncbi:unnamed protein product [Leptosia nina]|uniref:Uncharacterized protein n=1 Tax=Leptosia nina TaxID=320188 RepID=A0AAV1JLJ4_9NEOP
MSAKKGVDTKIFEDENTDSGFLSGPLSDQNLSEEFYPEEEPEETQKGDSKDVLTENIELDSGLISGECLSGEIDFHEESTPCSIPVPEQPLIVIDDHSSTSTAIQSQKFDLPPIKILFEQDEDGDTQLHIAAVHGCEKSVATLIKVCPDRELINICNSYGHTALHLAVLAGHPFITKMLVEAGASIATRDFNGETPLHIAVQRKYIRSLKYLLAPVKDQPRTYSSVLNQKNYKGQTCVHLAASKGYLEELRMLVAHGANINAKEGLAGRTPLHIAAQRNDEPLVMYLLRDGNADRGTRDYAGRTARRFASRSRVLHLFGDDYSDDDEDDSESEHESDMERFEEMRTMMAACTTTCA